MLLVLLDSGIADTSAHPHKQAEDNFTWNLLKVWALKGSCGRYQEGTKKPASIVKIITEATIILFSNKNITSGSKDHY